MIRVLAITLLVMATNLCATNEADAEPRGRLRLFSRTTTYGSPIAFGAPTFPSNYGNRYRSPSVDELYPKYYGSFHYRHLDNIGIPSGDIGLRGNGLYMSPW